MLFKEGSLSETKRKVLDFRSVWTTINQHIVFIAFAVFGAFDWTTQKNLGRFFDL